MRFGPKPVKEKQVDSNCKKTYKRVRRPNNKNAVDTVSHSENLKKNANIITPGKKHCDFSSNKNVNNPNFPQIENKIVFEYDTDSKKNILGRIRKNQLSLCEIANHLNLLFDSSVGKEFLELVFDVLVEYDVKIVSESEEMSVDDWYAVESPVSTPISDDTTKNVREDVQSFIHLFLKLQKYFKSNHIASVFELFEKYVFTSGTCYIQFLTFIFEPSTVLIYFFSSIKKNHILSQELLGFAASFIIHRKMEPAILVKSIKGFFNIFIQSENQNIFLSGLQFFILILTSHKRYFDMYSSQLVPLLNKHGHLLNKFIVKTFSKKFNLKPIKYFVDSLQSDIDRYFFGIPNITMILESVRDTLYSNEK